MNHKCVQAEVDLIKIADNKLLQMEPLPYLGLGYIAACLEKNGVNSKIIDAAFENRGRGDILDQINEFTAKIYGITSLTPEITKAHSLALAIKKAIPGSVIIVGGSHVSALPEETLREFSAFDFVVVGEGEYTMLELVAKLKNKDTDFSGVKGIAYRENGKIKINPKRDWIASLDDLPFPAWHLYPNIKNQRVFSLITSRGCPFRCIFCSRALGDKIRLRSAKNVINELLWLTTEFNVKYICFEDENFTYDTQRTEEILKFMIESGMSKKVEWYAVTRADLINFELLKMMKEAGCRDLGFGIESGNKEILNKLKKGVTLKQAAHGIDLAKKAGIRTQGYFILGNPNETIQTANETINFAVKLNPHRAEFFIMTPYPGTEVADFAKNNQEGYAGLSTDWPFYLKGLGVTEYKNIGRKKIKLLQLKAYFLFYIRTFRLKELFILFYRRRKSLFYQILKLTGIKNG